MVNAIRRPLSAASRIRPLDPYSGSRLWIRTLDLRTLDPYSGSRLWIRTLDPDSGSGLWIRTLDPDSGSVLCIRTLHNLKTLSCTGNLITFLFTGCLAVLEPEGGLLAEGNISPPQPVALSSKPPPAKEESQSKYRTESELLIGQETDGSSTSSKMKNHMKGLGTLA